ncbi:MAG TPA: Gfo/Idh/MocA family oxidoreductase [Spirochaetia bacterium]
MPQEANDSYGLAPESTRAEVPAPDLPYAPLDPARYRPRIGLVGCGGIAVQHLRAYSAAGYDVAVLCDRSPQKAVALRDRFYPGAEVCEDWRTLLRRGDIGVLDLAAHPEQRMEMFAPAIEAGKHILSQKPFVTDLDAGLAVAEMAEKRGVRIAVNQNGRWAPHWSWMRHAVTAGLVGDVTSVRAAVDWDHTWIKGSVFEEVPFLVLYDFGIHWFDIVSCFLSGRRARSVYASVARAPDQEVKPPLLSQVLMEYEGAQASLSFDASARFGEQARTYIAGTRGSVGSDGPSLNEQQVTLATAGGRARPSLVGAWFPDGFHGSMGELLRAVEEKREPENGARDNLESLALCFAALASARRREAVRPWTVRKLPE